MGGEYQCTKVVRNKEINNSVLYKVVKILAGNEVSMLVWNFWMMRRKGVGTREE
jgi:hypothetical protein